MAAIQNRYDFVILFEVENGNPNGDPDAGNLPRMDPETGIGLVSDVCLKRKIRNYVQQRGHNIYIQERQTLNSLDQSALGAQLIDTNDVKKLPERIKERKKDDPDLDIKLRDFMCQNFYDIRTFGAVMTTFVQAALNCGQVRGPVQLTFARSIDPVVPQEIAITRMAVTTEKDAAEKKNTIGRKHLIPYALYRAEGFVSANLAQKSTGFSEEDLALLWEAILNMFEDDHSAARGRMAVRELVIFRHETPCGNAPSHTLFERVRASKNTPVPRRYADYDIVVDDAELPEGVTLERRR
ncbi:MAG: type I-C CRISPR-associated protein Cas7/Csd2 [Oscillospiraceae bacterium]|jgi:CRISPR-associated protein Csd2|nr:type I-C CRISPR-associated protein Cas7/Csd2 [Oscillospiraceae bacterium]